MCARLCVSWKGEEGDESEPPTPRSLQLLLSPFLPNEGRALQPSSRPAPTSLHAGTAREAERQATDQSF